jgi:IS5 family transposase
VAAICRIEREAFRCRVKGSERGRKSQRGKEFVRAFRRFKNLQLLYLKIMLLAVKEKLDHRSNK